jgi:hypothetical protein
MTAMPSSRRYFLAGAASAAAGLVASRPARAPTGELAGSFRARRSSAIRCRWAQLVRRARVAYIAPVDGVRLWVRQSTISAPPDPSPGTRTP